MGFQMYRSTILIVLAVFICGCGPQWVGVNTLPVMAYSAPPEAGYLMQQQTLTPSMRGAYALYGNSGLLWHHANGLPTANGQRLYSLLSEASFYGLRPGNYLPETLLSKRTLSQSAGRKLYLVDQVLTRGLYEFAGDLVDGHSNPNPDPLKRRASFLSAVSASDLNQWLIKSEPQGQAYQNLKKALQTPNITPAMRSFVALNMERLRWIPEDNWKGPYIRVNIATATLEIFYRHRLQDSMRVIVGRFDRQTPLTIDSITHLQFAPDQAIPTRIVAMDFLPLLIQNPGALDPSIYDVRVKGRVVSFRQDWTSVRARDVLIRRTSGDAGPLGGVKFSMENQQGVFLHDTPYLGMFDNKLRTFSNGSIRVERAGDLSYWIMSHQRPRISRQDIDQRMRARTTSNSRLSRKIPVSVQYMTAYVDSRGQLRNAPDIYNLDKALAQRLGFRIERIDYN